ncbi:methyltransferase [Pontibacillus halophilus JSM 076056 = DSM 19796]|uniref:Methyltransferase n=1 Tax=Pontibacillus halophilus JSM 076056 = DSM 19796 TaxID=1385510 RepID=A0A0A5GH68_9BACI|nr:class I SAM-dependent methyltransferase [Pontibacillus halophilus]KGX90543.1 methyltransferase [Pontibacillus halophilus JSM 076056 = DSM 19796]
MGFLFSQFSKPKGLIGKLAGTFMYKENAAINEWTSSFLDIKEDDRVLEIGFGPGYCIQHLCEQQREVNVTGIDPSGDMVDQASKRNRQYLHEGRVELYEGEAGLVCQLEGTFDKVLAINNITYWKNPVKTLTQIRQRLAPNGRIAITVQPHEKGATDETSHNLGEQIHSLLTQAGYNGISIYLKDDEPTNVTCVVASRGEKA